MQTPIYYITGKPIPRWQLRNKILVWHIKDAYFDKYLFFRKPNPLPKWYEFVAAVDSSSLDVAFGLTNHDDELWYRKPGVRCFSDKARSTSNGDLLVDANGDTHLLTGYGWKKVWPNQIWLHL